MNVVWFGFVMSKEFRRMLAFPMMFIDGEFIPNQNIDEKIRELVKNAKYKNLNN